MARRYHETFIPRSLRPAVRVGFCRPIEEVHADPKAQEENPVKTERRAVRRPILKIARAAAALAAAASLAAPARAETVRGGVFDAPGDAPIVLAQDKGEVEIVAGPAGRVSWEVRFSRSLWTGGDFAGGSLSADAAARRLTVQAGRGGHAKTVLRVPADAALDVRFGEGNLTVARRPGRVRASVANGTLELDASDLPRSACVQARATNGTIASPWGSKEGTGVEIGGACADPAVALQVGNGAIEVR